jgi:hypothetical protein
MARLESVVDVRDPKENMHIEMFHPAIKNDEAFRKEYLNSDASNFSSQRAPLSVYIPNLIILAYKNRRSYLKNHYFRYYHLI